MLCFSRNLHSCLFAGNPITQNIVDSGSGVSVFGEGLGKAEVGRTAKFFVDTKGHRGEITHYQVDGELKCVYYIINS